MAAGVSPASSGISRDIGTVNGDLGISAYFYAGATISDPTSSTATITPLYAGKIGVLKTKKPSNKLPVRPPAPYITGRAYVRAGGAPKRSGGTDTIEIITGTPLPPPETDYTGSVSARSSQAVLNAVLR